MAYVLIMVHVVHVVYAVYVLIVVHVVHVVHVVYVLIVVHVLLVVYVVYVLTVVHVLIVVYVLLVVYVLFCWLPLPPEIRVFFSISRCTTFAAPARSRPQRGSTANQRSL